MVQIATFKSPSKAEFVLKVPSRQAKPRLSHAKRGDTFLWQAAHGRHDAAVCMLTTVSAYQYAIKQSQAHQNVLKKAQDSGIWIINLQTGRTFTAEDCEIEFVKLTIHVEGY